MELKAKKVSILGMGESGKATALALKELGAEIFISEKNKTPDLEQLLTRIEADAEFGEHSPRIYQGKDLIVISPGVPTYLPVLEAARQKGIEVIGELELAFRLCNKPVIAVTGSKGKSTTCSLIHRLLSAENFKTYLGGNIGNPFMSGIKEAQAADLVILEVSSFQLETIQEFRPKISVFLNFFPDHLDRHKDLEEYFNAKLQLFSRQTEEDFAVLYGGEEILRRHSPFIKAKTLWFQLKKAEGVSAFYQGGELYTVVNQKEIKLPLKELKLLGEHNLKNILAALLVCRLAGSELKNAPAVLEDFTPLPHRLQLVFSHQGVNYIDDSKSTIPHSAGAALASFPEQKVILITGGKDKGIAVEPLTEMIRQRAKAVILIGELKAKLKAQLEKNGFSAFWTADSLKEAVLKARRLIKTGDTLLFSPAGSSFDMFNSAEERGEAFVQIVKGEKL